MMVRKTIILGIIQGQLGSKFIIFIIMLEITGVDPNRQKNSNYSLLKRPILFFAVWIKSVSNLSDMLVFPSILPVLSLSTSHLIPSSKIVGCFVIIVSFSVDIVIGLVESCSLSHPLLCAL